jgi:YbbR domain-containing protein
VRISNLLFRNLPAKLFSLFFALVLWVVVIGQKQAEIKMNVPLEIVNIPAGTVLVSDIPPNIALQLRGPRTILRTMPGRGTRKRIDLEGIELGWTTIRILPDSISLPRGIEVTRVTPSSLELKLEPVKEVSVPVEAQLSGDPPAGYKLDGISVDPPLVRLRGGERELSRLSSVKTNPIKISEAKAASEEKVALSWTKRSKMLLFVASRTR